MANVSVANTPGLYQINATNSILTSAQNLYTLLANSTSVGFYLTNANADVAATTLATGVTSGTYGDSNDIPVITVGADGRISAISTVGATGSTYGNANVTALLSGAVTIGNLTVNAGIYWANGQPYSSGSIYGNANVAAYLASNTDPTISSLNANTHQVQTQISTINANIGSFYTYANATYSTIANAASQEGEISSLRANIIAANAQIQTISANLGSFETYANTTFQTTAGAYSNANVASYLPVYSGNIRAGNITVVTNLYSNDIIATNVAIEGDSIIYGNLTVNGNTTIINSNTVVTNDKVLVLANNQSTGAAVNGAGLQVGSPAVGTFLYNNTSTSWQSSLSIAPSANATYSLGSPTLQWNNAYAHYFIGDGSQLVNLPQQSGTYSNANVASYLPTYSGVLTAGNITTTNGVYWSNGAPYSTPFVGNLAGNPLYDSVNNRVNIQAYPLSTPTSNPHAQYYYEWFVNNPNGIVYSGNVLQPPGITYTSTGTGQIYAQVTTSNIGLQSSYQTSTTRISTATAQYAQVWPITANNMTSSDRLYVNGRITDVVLTNGIQWPATTPTYNSSYVLNDFSALSLNGSGTIGTVHGSKVTIATAPTSGGQANVTYAINYFAALAANNNITSGAGFQSNVQNWYGFTGQNSATVNAYNNIGTAALFYVPAGWVASGSPYVGSKYALLNQDATSPIQSNANIILASGSGASLIFQDGTVQTTAATANTYGNTQVSVYLPHATGYTDGWQMPIGGNSARPAFAANGMIRFNSDTLNPEWYSGINSTWYNFNQAYTPPATTYSASYLVVAGGGGGGTNTGGGGGAGGLLSGTTTLTIGTTYTVVVGAGGTPGSGSPSVGNNGNNSTIAALSLTALGGGGGGGGGQNGASGGSGGGGGVIANGASGTAGQGNAGGNGGANSSPYPSGGGGGAGGVGGTASGSGGSGGVGSSSSITGTATYYAGGGGGSDANSGSSGGLGGGGGSPTGFGNTGTNGTANTGGGGGAGSPGGGQGGSGGSGVVILSVPTANYSGTTTGSPSISTSGSNTIITFTGSGSYTA